MKNKIFIIFLFIMNYFVYPSNIYSQSNITDKQSTVFKNWQARLGYSLNNKNIYNIEGSYLISLSHVFAFSLDTRIYSFLTVSPSLATQPIPVSEKISFSLKTGLGFIFFGPVAGLNDIAFEFGALVRYSINKYYNIILEYKQIKKNSAYLGFDTLPPKQIVQNFPIRFISIGIEF